MKNTVTLVGFVGNTPEVRSSQSGAAITNLSLATTRSYKDGDQRQHMLKVAGVSVLVGALLWAGLAGPIARSLPASWQLPERMARRTLGAPTLIDAGSRLLLSADPTRWKEVVEAAKLSADNREAITRCKSMARKTGRTANCLLRVDG